MRKTVKDAEKGYGLLKTAKDSEREGVRDEEVALSDAGNFLLGDIARFLRRGWWIIVLLTALFAAILAVLPFVVPPRYDKKLSLEVTPVLIDLQKNLGQKEVGANLNQIGATAALYVNKVDLGQEGTADAAYNTDTGRVDVTLRSSNGGDFDLAESGVIAAVNQRFQRTYEKSLGKAVEAQLTNLETASQENRAFVARIEQQLSGAEPGGAKDSLTKVRADALASRGQIESKQEYFERAAEDLPRLTDAAIEVETVSESKVRKFEFAMPSTWSIILLALVSAILSNSLISALRSKRQD